jgi:NAD(P)-dependent dehydrogenase (short-subunit alcohol dehydrogenase family)
MSGAGSDRFRGQVAIVTGGASGIGRSVATRLVREGAAVAVADKDADRVHECVSALEAVNPGAGHIGLPLDVRRIEDMESLGTKVLERAGRIDILVVCAGILRGVSGRPQLLAETSAEAWDAVIDTNLTGTYLANRSVLPVMMKQRRGNIINLSSTSGRRGLAYDAAYCASKFGVIGFSESLAEEVRPHGIRVQAVLPEVVDTPMLKQSGPIVMPQEMLSADRVADFILFLLGLPEDTLMMNPVIAPFRTRKRAARQGRTT